ncbi:MAG: DUF1614 domain-containing protein [Candidatus Aramenus sp.]|nr:DUF1614 domain-containing protein [Candidatus Aramenus sp.]
MKRIVIFSPYRGILMPLYFLLGLLLMVIAIGYFKDLLTLVGVNRQVSYFLAFEMSFLSLAMSPVNIVVKEVRKEYFQTYQEVIYVFGIPFYVPRLSWDYAVTLIAVNVGGALIPVLFSLTLLFLLGSRIYLVLVNVIAITLVSKHFSKVIPGVGVAMHPLIAPIFSTLISYLLLFRDPLLVPVSAYIGSVFGTLIGADLLNLRKIIEANPQIVSIGGAGSFDGIFLSGLFSIVLAELLISL